MQSLDHALDQLSHYIKLCDQYLAATDYVHENIPLPSLLREIRGKVFPGFCIDKFNDAIFSLESWISQLQSESTVGATGLCRQQQTEEERVKNQLGDLQEALAQEKAALARERQRTRELEANQQTTNESSSRLLAMAEAALQSIEAELSQLQHSGLDPHLIEEETANLNHRKSLLLRELTQLREVNTKMEQL